MQLLTASPRLNLLALTQLALMAYTADVETVWDLSNRVCDRYFPKASDLKARFSE